MTQKKKKAIKKITNHAFEVVIGSSIYAAMEAAEIELVNQLKTAVANVTTYQIAIDTNSNLNKEAIIYLSKKYLKKTNPLEKLINRGEDNDGASPSITPSEMKNKSIIIHKGTPILLVKWMAAALNHKNFISEDDFRPQSLYDHPRHIIPVRLSWPIASQQRSESKTSTFEGFKLITLNTEKDRENLDDFVKKVFKKSEKANRQVKKSKWIHFNSDCSETSMKKRDMNTVFMPNSMKEDLMSSIDHFVKKRDWYEKNFVPYHYGILLYGPPGTGKSTLIRSIMTEYYEKYEDASGPVVFKRPGSLLGLGIDTFDVEYKKPKIVVIEDIDATKTTKTRTPKPLLRSDEVDDDDDYNYNYNTSMSLSELLNKIDGLSNLENVIYIFTTNHIENLDKALIRPGRIDKLVKIDIPDRNAYDQFMFYHFGKHIPKDMKVKKGILIPELQNMIVCEKTYDDILDYLREEEF